MSRVAPLAPSGLVDASGRSISTLEVSRVRAKALTGVGLGADFGRPAYEGAGTRGTFLSEWPALLRSADKDWLPSRGGVTARARDLIRNDVVAASAVQRRKNAAVGRGWRLSSRPKARALGISPEAARELGAQIETEWSLYANSHAFESDAERRMTFGQQLRLAAAQLAGAEGEALGLAEWDETATTRYKTRLRMVDPDRLTTPHGRHPTVRAGVEQSAFGAPIAYHIREAHPSETLRTGLPHWRRIERFTGWGRPQVFHCFEVERAGQTRGVSRFAAALKSFRAFGKFTDATLETATINSLIVGFMKSNSGPQAAGDSFNVEDVRSFETFRQTYYSENPVSLASGARLPVLPYGDEIELQTSSRDVADFEGFIRSIIRLIAASLGVTYEELSMDYSQTNYSSARAAMVHAWAETQALVALLKAGLVQPYFVAWLEEAFDKGYIVPPPGAPDFYDAVDAYASAEWIGPGRGYIDPTKEIDAAAGRIEAGISTLEDECADQGKDWEEVLEQRAREAERAAELGLRTYDTGLSLAYAADGEVAEPGSGEDVEAVPPADARPPTRGLFRRAGSALARIARVSRSAEHNASLDQRAA